MRELVLNDACLEGLPSLDVGAAVAADVEKGISTLVAAGHALTRMRMAASVAEIPLAGGHTLSDVLVHLVRTTPTSGRLLTRIATMYPVEDALGEDDFAALVAWSLPEHPACLSLALCACSGRIAVTLSVEPRWMVDPLRLVVVRDSEKRDETVVAEVDNVFSSASAAALVARLAAAAVANAGPAELWQARTRLFPNLLFAPRVEKDLRDLGSIQYDAAVGRLGELDRATANWAPDQASPEYLSSVSPESKSTMQKYGDRRVFRSSDGTDQTFELHARLPGGFRVHLREIAVDRKVEVGYVGPHLPIASER